MKLLFYIALLLLVSCQSMIAPNKTNPLRELLYINALQDWFEEVVRDRDGFYMRLRVIHDYGTFVQNTDNNTLYYYQHFPSICAIPTDITHIKYEFFDSSYIKYDFSKGDTVITEYKLNVFEDGLSFCSTQGDSTQCIEYEIISDNGITYKSDSITTDFTNTEIIHKDYICYIKGRLKEGAFDVTILRNIESQDTIFECAYEQFVLSKYDPHIVLNRPSYKNEIKLSVINDSLFKSGKYQNWAYFGGSKMPIHTHFRQFYSYDYLPMSEYDVKKLVYDTLGIRYF